MGDYLRPPGERTNWATVDLHAHEAGNGGQAKEDLQSSGSLLLGSLRHRPLTTIANAILFDVEFLAWTALLLFALQAAFAQSTWLTDEQARDVAGSAIHSENPRPCYSTYRHKRLESSLLSVRKYGKR